MRGITPTAEKDDVAGARRKPGRAAWKKDSEKKESRVEPLRQTTTRRTGASLFVGDPSNDSRAKRCSDWIRDQSARLCSSTRFNVLTTVLTIYALFGDDFRVAATSRRTDNLFNSVTILCILVFVSEIVAASCGKSDYFGGFFFWLDTLSTVTLGLDLTWMADMLFCSNANSSGAASQTAQTTLAGRAGARASRTVRIIRLIRLAKLYKTYKAAMEQKAAAAAAAAAAAKEAEAGSAVPGEEDPLKDEVEEFDEDDPLQDSEDIDDKKTEEVPEQGDNETRVGKKLGDMTTRRVIILVLVMLCVMPAFQSSWHGYPDLESSVRAAIEVVYWRWGAWCNFSAAASGGLPGCIQALSEGTDYDPDTELWKLRWYYEKFLLDFAHQHHGDAATSGDDLFWIGIQSEALSSRIGKGAALNAMGNMARLQSAAFLGEHAVPANDWDSQWVKQTWKDKLLVASLEDNVKERLMAPWREKCEIIGKTYIGVVLTNLWEGSSTSTDCSISEELRCTEWEQHSPRTQTETEEDWTEMSFVLDLRAVTSLESALSMVQTVFICLAVGVGSMFFAKDANELLLHPIQRMITKMETIKDNPLEAMRLGDMEYRREEIETVRQKEELAKLSRVWRVLAYYQMKRVKEPMETVILEKTIIKLGGLLALGFGEAGAEIIGQNMQGGHSAELNVMVPGQKVDCIIGFCHIRHFSLATDILKEKVMLFVNQVGEIVHGCVDDYFGAPNKNIGDSFLMIWRISGVPKEKQTKLADMSIMSFIRIVAEINKSPVLASYRNHPGLLQQLPDFRVQLGFGLHCGWAIEGAIGSEFKIDASYLSPNVNVASMLEAATAQFGVCILISHFMIGLCSHELALVCRLIDHVTLRGSKYPVRLYTVDLDYKKVEVFFKPMDRVIKNRFKCRQVRELRKMDKWKEEYNVWDLFDSDDDLKLMRSTFSVEFFKRFAMAYRNYEAGQWLVARDMLYTCHYTPRTNVGIPIGDTDESCWPDDGPTISLLNYMRDRDFAPPLDWRGYREL